jgi:hypothetical protein
MWIIIRTMGNNSTARMAEPSSVGRKQRLNSDGECNDSHHSVFSLFVIALAG